MNPASILQIAFERAGIDAFESSGVLLVLLAAAAAFLIAALRRSHPAIGWPAMAEAEAAGLGRREIRPALALCLRALVLVILAFVLAGPVSLRELPPAPGRGLDLVLVLDASGSMRALDTQLGDRQLTRLELARRVVTRFASQRVAEGDRVGLVVFGERAFTQCPLTSDGGLLSASLRRVEVGVAGESTALGDALALSVERVAGAGLGEVESAGESSGSGHVVVLLTDGRSNAGGIPVGVAAQLARSAGVRVHTVGIGTGGDRVPMAAPSAAAGSGRPRFERHDPDLETLREIARATGGRSFEARRAMDLAAVYAEIDTIERGERALEPRVRIHPRPEPLLALAGGLVLTEIVLARLLRRRLH